MITLLTIPLRPPSDHDDVLRELSRNVAGAFSGKEHG